jgi:ABC-type iron transport system FetAB ATPase subunit
MLLGNCINGISLALNSVLTSFVESAREIELLLSFGASSYEATARIFREAVRAGAMPQLNGMAIIGLISIPGMMTGQILGGTTVMQAARYQILIMYYIALCSFVTILMEMYITLEVCFDSRTILQSHLLLKRDKNPTFLAIIKSICKGICRVFAFKKRVPRRQSVVMYHDNESSYLSPNDGVLTVTTSSNYKELNGDIPVLSVNQLSYGFETAVDEEELVEGDSEGDNSTRFRVLFEKSSFQLSAGATAIVTGPSGVGKSSLLRILAGLLDADADKISLHGKTQKSYVNMPLWRKQVRYVPQTKIDIPGNPNDFMEMVSSFKSWKIDQKGSAPSYSEMKLETKELVRSWGMSTSLLESEWKTLSGGESQRALVAISLASLPTGGVILLDESTSALDEATKLKVEKSVEEYCTKKSVVAIWISHDQAQQNRMKQK